MVLLVSFILYSHLLYGLPYCYLGSPLIEISRMFYSIQELRTPTNRTVVIGSQCTTSVDSISDYGQYAISQSGLEHIMYSVVTAQSTVDFSMTLVDYNVIDSPPSGVKRPCIVSSPSPLKSRSMHSSRDHHSTLNGVPVKMLYVEEDSDVHAIKVCLI